MQSMFEWCYAQSFTAWCWISLVGNLLEAGLSIFVCWLGCKFFLRRPIFITPQPITRSDVWFTFGAIFFNSVVGMVGWVLWHHGWIGIAHPAWPRAAVDTLVLIGVMDFAMYVFHRVAHYPPLFRVIHASHHEHASTNPLSLFVLNPFEVLGFGFLLIAALMLYPFSGAAVIAYLAFNLIFGTVGHLGVEPLPDWLRCRRPFNYLGTSTFHGLHHADRGYNFGFYTTVWDRLFHTLEPHYDGHVAPR